MTLARRVIPVLLHREGRLVKGERFNPWRSIGHPLVAARTHARRGVDELMVLDVGATPAGRGPDFNFVRRLTDSLFTPVTVGGGVRSLTDVRDLLLAGADKVLIETALYRQPGMVREAVARFGCQAIVGGIAYRRGSVCIECGHLPVPARPVAFAEFVTEGLGVGELLLQSVDRDGTLEGYDLETLGQVVAAVSVPVVVCCGAGSYEHLASGVNAGASAVAAGALFSFTEATPKRAAEFLAEHGIEARL